MSKTEKFLDYIKQTKSKNTYKEYKHGINAFSKWYGKDPDTVLEERREDVASGDFDRNMRFGREVDKFHASLIKEGYSINSARTMTLGIKQLFKFYGFPVKTTSYDTVITTKDFVPTIEQYRAMFNVSDIQTRTIISMGLDLGWRIGDLLSLTKSDIPDLNQKTPIPFDLVTEKEKVISKTFLSAETVALLKTYLPTLPQHNPYLFPSNGKQSLKGEAINYKLREACKKAKIKILIISYDSLLTNKAYQLLTNNNIRVFTTDTVMSIAKHNPRNNPKLFYSLKSQFDQFLTDIEQSAQYQQTQLPYKPLNPYQPANFGCVSQHSYVTSNTTTITTNTNPNTHDRVTKKLQLTNDQINHIEECFSTIKSLQFG